MATIADLAAATSAAAGDLLVIRQSSTDKKIDAGLVPWTNSPSTFARGINITPPATSGESASNVDMPSGVISNQRAYRWSHNAVLRGYINCQAAANQLLMAVFDNGTGAGSNVIVQQNNNASTPAAGFLTIYTNGGSARRIWPDNTGLLRIHTADPTNANDTAGTVVGTQSSSLDVKDVVGAGPDGATALAHVEQGALAVREFTYKNGEFGGERFSGLVVDYAPRYGMDRDAEHPAGKSLNVVTALGDLMIAVSYLAGRVAALEAQDV
jgi:hypothetical protein